MDFNFNFKDLNTNKITALAGVSGCFVVGFGLLASATHYSGKQEYSVLNHFISELGLERASSMAYVFNRSLMTGGILFMIFAMGLGNYFGKSIPAKIATATGMISTLSFSAIGYYTGDTWVAHLIVASVFFAGAMITILLFSYAMWTNRQAGFHPAICMQGLMVAAFYFVAMLWPKELLFQSINDPEHFVRPAYWVLTMLEWGYCLMVCAWILMVSANLAYIIRTEPSEVRDTASE